ncbi:MAG: hypothetical protein ACOYXO_09235 [Chloroflexota bacterium]|jgi:hypothetical protein
MTTGKVIAIAVQVSAEWLTVLLTRLRTHRFSSAIPQPLLKPAVEQNAKD